jgi:hypothetical protein
MNQQRDDDKLSQGPAYRKSKTKKIPLEVKTTITKRSIFKIFQKITVKLRA